MQLSENALCSILSTAKKKKEREGGPKLYAQLTSWVLQSHCSVLSRPRAPFPRACPGIRLLREASPGVRSCAPDWQPSSTSPEISQT